MSTICEMSQTNQTFQRRRIALVFVVGVVCSFWFLSRYPDLMVEYFRASNQQLLDRDVGVLSKDAMLVTHNMTGQFELFWRATIDWFDTNKIGMTFGFLFSAAILLLLEQSAVIRKQATRKGWQGVLSGLLIGMPLGVCANCATPVALGLNKSGVSDDASFTTLISSPSLNPIGLGILFYTFPMEVGLLRIGVMFGFLFLILPFLTRMFGAVKAPLFEVSKPQSKEAKPSETWQQSLQYCWHRYRYYLFYTFKQVLPLMILMGMLGALILALFPLQNFVLGNTVTIGHIILAGLIGTFLPVPMFVDLILVFMLYQIGLPLSICVTLLLTMAPISAFSMLVMGRSVGWRLSMSISVMIAFLGIVVGCLVQYQQINAGVANAKVDNFTPFTIVKTVKSKGSFDFATFNSSFGSGVSVMDFDNDGLSDVLLPGNHGARLYKNIGGMNLKEVTKTSGIDGSLDSMAGIWGDYNNDGLIDLYLVNYKDKFGKPLSNQLYKNLGKGTFQNVTQQVNLVDSDLSSSAAWADFDGDGDLDLFVANYGEIWIEGSNAIHGRSERDRLYRNDDGHFVDVTIEAGVGGTKHQTEALLEIDSKTLAANRGFTFQPVWFDFNNDNLPDLYISQDFGTGQLYKNNGNGTFSNVTKRMGLNVYGTGMGASVMDINNDGFWDLFVTTGNANQLWINQSGRSFRNKIKQYGMADKTRFGWGVAAIDVENSMEPSLFIANGPTAKGGDLNQNQELLMKVSSINPFFVKQEDGRYKNMEKKYHVYNESVGRGIALGDLNNDGSVDMVLSNRDDKAQMVIYQNNNKKNHYLQFKLVGSGAINTMAIGSKISVYSKGKVQHQLLSTGTSFLSQSSRILTFGIGKAKMADKVIITWPNGETRALKKVLADRLITVTY